MPIYEPDAVEADPSQPCVYGYVRSRRIRPRRTREKIEPQQDSIRVWAEKTNRQVTMWAPDLGAADAIEPLFKRQQGKELLAKVRRGDTIVAAGFDRLFGTPQDAHASLVHARRLGFHICALDVGGGELKLEQSRSTFAILLALAVDTPYSRSLDQKANKQAQAGRDRFRGGTVPFGFRKAGDGTLVRHEGEQAFIPKLRHMRQRGMTYEKMASAAQAEGHKLTGPGISKILARAK